MTLNPYRAVLFLILLGAAVSRFYGLEIQSLWNDELSSWSRSNYASLTDVITRGVIPDVHPPGYQILLYYVEQYLGDQPFVLRMPSAIAGFFSVWAMFLLGKKLFSKQEGLLAAALLLFSYQALYFSQEARAYSLLMLFSILSSYFQISLFKLFSKSEEQKVSAKILCYMVTASIASYIHYFGLLLVFSQGIFSAFYCAKNRSKWPAFLFIYLLVFLAYIPWMPAFFSQLNGGDIWIKSPSPDAFYKFLKFAFSGAPGVFWLMLVTIFLMYWSNRKSLKFVGVSWQTQYLIAWLLVPFLLAYLKSIASSPILSNRNLLVILPALFLLIAHSIFAAPSKQKTKLAIAALLCGVFFLRTFVDKGFYTVPIKEQFRETISYVVEKEQGYTDKPFVIGVVWNKAYLEYYLKNYDSKLEVDLVTQEQARDFNGIVDSISVDRVWIVGGHLVPNADLISNMERKFKKVFHEDFIGASARLYVRK